MNVSVSENEYNASLLNESNVAISFSGTVDMVDGAENCDNEYILNVMTELDGTKRQLACERQRIMELEDQLSSLSK